MNTIRIEAQEWFDKANGNSYFSSRVYIDGDLKLIMPFQYGYGDHYVDMANQKLDELGFVDCPRGASGVYYPLHRYCEDHDIELITFKQDKCLKRELDKKEVIYA